MATYSKTNFKNVDNERPNTFNEARSGNIVTHSPAFGVVTEAGVAPAISVLNKQEDGVAALHQQIDGNGTAFVHEQLFNKTLQEQVDYINSKVYKFDYTIPYNGAQKVIFPKAIQNDATIRITYSGNAAVSITEFNDILLNDADYSGFKTDESGNHISLIAYYDGTNGAAVGPVQIVANHPDVGTFYSHATTEITREANGYGFNYVSHSNHSKTGSFSESIRGNTAKEPAFDVGISSMLINVHGLQSGNPSRPQYVRVEVIYH